MQHGFDPIEGIRADLTSAPISASDLGSKNIFIARYERSNFLRTDVTFILTAVGFRVDEKQRFYSYNGTDLIPDNGTRF